MTYLSNAEALKRADTGFLATDDLTAALTDIDSVINTCLGLTSNTTDAQTMATILPIAGRMIRMEVAMRKTDKMVDASASIQLAGQLAALGIATPIQLTQKERAMLLDAYQGSGADTGKSNVVMVYNTRTGRRLR